MTTPEPSSTSGSGSTHDPVEPRNGGGDTANSPAGEAAWAAAVARLAEPLGEAMRHARRLLSVRTEEARQRLRRARWALVQGLVLGIAAAALTIAGVIYLARGLAGTLGAALAGQPWLGELLAGAILLTLAVAGSAVARARDERKEFERLRRKYERDETKRRDDQRISNPEAKAEDGGGAPRAGASTSPRGPETEPPGPGR